MSLIDILLEVGNTHSIVKNPNKSRSGMLNKHRWNCYVKMSPDSKNKLRLDQFIDHIRFELDPGFA